MAVHMMELIGSILLNTCIILALVYVIVGITTAMLSIVVHTVTAIIDPRKYKAWVDDRPIKAVPAFIQLVLFAVVFWPVVFFYRKGK